MVIQLAVEPCDFDRLMAFGADAIECEDGGDGEPYACPPMSPCWFWEGGATFFGRPTDQVLDLVPPKQLGRAAVRNAQAVVPALLLITGLGLEARADQMAAMTQALPTSTAEAPRQCAVALTVLLGTGFGLESADQAPTVTGALPMSSAEAPAQAPAMTGALPTATAEAPAQCCQLCKKGKLCGDGCISAERQCKKDEGCACSAASSS
jgi:hypothetical protein